MNIFKRYMAIVIALTSVQSFPLGAMKQEEQSNEPFSENKRKRDDNIEIPNKKEVIKKRKLQEKSFLNAANKNNITIIMKNCGQMSKDILEKALTIATTKHQKNLVKILTNQLNARNQVEKIEENKNEKTTTDTEEISEKCSFCQELLCNESEKNISLPCSEKISHVFHKECILQWARRAILDRKLKENQFVFSCPSCKHEYYVKDYLSHDEINKLDTFKTPNTLDDAWNSFKMIIECQDGLVSDEDINRFCDYILGKGFWDIIKNLFAIVPLRMRLSDNNIRNVFFGAALNGHFLIIQEFFKKENKEILDKMSNFYLSCGFKDAASNGHFLVVQEFFKKENEKILDKIDDWNLSCGFKDAASNGHFLVVQEFFKKENEKILDKINDLTFAETFKNAISKISKNAVSNGDLLIVQEFFKKENEKILDKIRDNDIRSVFKEAIKRDDFLIMREFLKKENEKVLEKISFSILSLESAFVNAAKNDCYSTIEKFFKKENKEILEKISNNGLGKALRGAAENGCYSTIENFFKKENKEILEKISNNDLGKALSGAAKSGRYSTIENFFKKENKEILEKISNNDLGKTLRRAAKNGCYSTIEEFFKKENKEILEKISNNDLGKALSGAAKNGCSSIIKKFFKEKNKEILNKISDNDLSMAFRIAAKNGHKVVIREFLKAENKIVQDRLSIDALEEAKLEISNEEIRNKIDTCINSKPKSIFSGCLFQ